VELPPVAKGVQQVTAEYLEYGLIYAFTVQLVDLNGNRSLGSVIVVPLNRVVTDLDLGQYITAPVANAAPDTRAFVGPQYTGTLIWRRVGSGFEGNFAPGIEYIARVTLKANAGYTFAGLGTNKFTYGGAGVTSNANGNAEIIFPALGAAWYVADYGFDTSDGLTHTTALATVDKALEKIAIAYRGAHTWTHADIVIIGTTGDTKTVTINDTEDKDNSNSGSSTDEYPPITLRGMSPAQPGILTADKAGWSTSTYRVLEVLNGAEVTLGNDLTITGGGKRSLSGLLHGAGVYVNNYSSFTMNGGTITANTTYGAGYGGGVYVHSYSTFIMNSGIISDNYGFYTGGVSARTGTSVTMTGGTITGNTSNTSGGGMRVVNSTFTMTGGTISGNISETDHGGGINIASGSFTMSGGLITGNTAVMGNGGGVYVSTDGNFTISGGTISNNTANQTGGGIYVGPGGLTLTMQGGIIAGNTGGVSGGGVFVNAGTGVFTKAPLVEGNASGIIYGNDGTANANKATQAVTDQTNDKGHAVYVSTGPKHREITAGPDQQLDSSVTGATGGWVE
jgi:hypothetical protein